MRNEDTWEFREAVFLTWNQSSTLLSVRLFELLGRDIAPRSFQDGDYWDVYTQDLTQAEMDLLLDVAGADDEDRENHIPNAEGRIRGITEYLAAKLLSPEMPFSVDRTVATENGVYFMSASEPYVKDYTGRANPNNKR